MSAAACLTLGGMHLLVWLKGGRSSAHPAFFLTALAVAGVAAGELLMMHAGSPADYASFLRWTHVPLMLLVVGIVWFVGSYFRTGRAWLGGAAIGLRLITLAVNFTIPQNLNYREIRSLDTVSFLGEQVSLAGDVAINPWNRLGELSSLFVLGFVIDASVRLWKKGGRNERRRALTVGGGIAVSIVLAAGYTLLIHTGSVQSPYFVSLSFAILVIAMANELSRDVISAARSAEALEESRQQMTLAATAGNLATWIWDLPKNVLWLTPEGRFLHGLSLAERIDEKRFLASVHSDDRELVRGDIERALTGGGAFSTQYRVALPGGESRWIASHGKVEMDGKAKPSRMLGVSIDITNRRRAEREAEEQRKEMTHLSRVSVLGHLTGALAHELNQPLGIILSNAQAAQRMLNGESLNIPELREILSDIISEDRRAGEVIKRLRALLKRGETQLVSIDLNGVIEDSQHLLRSDLISRGVKVRKTLADGISNICGDHVQIEQVLLNLIVNACDAMSDNSPEERTLWISTSEQAGIVTLSLQDQGCGLPDGDPGRIFEPFVTTKSMGLGIGLFICRSIVAAHNGRLWAEPNLGRGATFHVEFPAIESGM